MKCAWCECGQQATVLPKLMIPLVGYSVHCEPFSCLLGIPCCPEHVGKIDIPTFLDSHTASDDRTHREVFRLLGCNHLIPDFERAFIDPIDIHSEAAQQLLARSKVNGSSESIS